MELTILAVRSRLTITLRGVVQSRRILGGIKSNNTTEGAIDKIVSSNRRVKSKDDLPGSLRKGPKLLSYEFAVEFTALD
jgi:hypothetical protein